MNGDVSWLFERGKLARDRRSLVRLLLADVIDAMSTMAAILMVGRWGEADDPKQIEWSTWEADRRELATLLGHNATWGNLATLSLIVQWANSQVRARGGKPQKPPTDDDSTRVARGTSCAESRPQTTYPRSSEATAVVAASKQPPYVPASHRDSPRDGPQGAKRDDAGSAARNDPVDLGTVRGERYPMLGMPAEWERLEDGTPAPDRVAAVALSRIGQ